MTLCDSGCGTTLSQTDHPTYDLRIVETYAVSKVYHFCSVGCLHDFTDLSSQGLKPLEFQPKWDGMSDEFEDMMRKKLNAQ